MELIDKYEFKDKLYDRRNGKLSDADMEIWHMINEMPVSYNIDNVIKELNRMKEIGCTDFEKAIEIVERGGIKK